MTLPAPFPGLVIHYGYLWHDQHRRGLEEGNKLRPSVVVLATRQDDGGTVVIVAPITHAAPRKDGDAVEIPPSTKRRLGLDDDRSWVVVTEVNRFLWPGYDLHPTPGSRDYVYGVLPPALFRQVRDRIAGYARDRGLFITSRQ